MKIIDVKQGSLDWKIARAGIPTSSNFSKIVTTTGEKSKQAEKYMYQLAGERFNGISEEMPKTAAMQRGNDLEAEAREFYELVTGRKTQQVGFCLIDNGDGVKFGSSPDALIDEDGGLEVKCPLPATHIEYVLGNKFPMEYYQQVQGNMLVTGRKWWELLSFHPHMRPFLIRLERNDEFIAKLSTELIEFCTNLDLLVTKLKEK